MGVKQLFFSGAVLAASTAISSGVVLVTEDFETEGNVLNGGSRYLANYHDDGGGDFFVRENYPSPDHQQAVTVGAQHGSFGLHGEDVDTGDNPLASGLAVVRIADFAVAGYNNFTVTVSLGVSALNTSWETDDTIRIRAAFDTDSGGTAANVSDLDLGNYSVVGQFLGEGTSAPNIGPTLDADLNGSIDGSETTQIGQAMTDYTFTIPSTGNILSVEVVVDADGGNEEFAIDNIVIEGELVPEPSGVALIFLSVAGLVLRRRR